MAKNKHKKAKPGRPRQHELGDLAYTKFLVARPSAWVVNKIDGTNDYGRDALVELFEDGEATGDEFSAQFKGTDDGGEPKTRLKIKTLNLWEDQPSPTLVVVWKSETDTLFYQWAHLLPFHRTKPKQKERTVHVPNEWTEDTPAELAAEIQAFRGARSLAHHFPIDVHVTGESFFGGDAGQIVAAVIDVLDPLRDFDVTFGTPRIPYLRIAVQDNGVDVSLSGLAIKSVTYGGGQPPPAEVVAADALFALSFAVGVTGGSPESGALLMEAAAEQSFMAIFAGRLGDAVAILARRGSDEAVMALLRRSLLLDGHPNALEAWAGLMAARAETSEDLRRKIADALEGSAPTWKRPSECLQRAALVLAHVDQARSLSLWAKAAEEDSTLKKEPHYWRERGGLFLMSGRYSEAAESYRAAVKLRDESARPLLADALMWSGEYAQALREFERSNIRDGNENAEWRRNRLALDILVEGMGITRQERDDFIAERMWADRIDSGIPPTPEFIAEVLAVDALFGTAHWAEAPQQAEENIVPIGSLVLASISLGGIPAVWQELICAALNLGARQTARDALLLARRFCRADFLKLLHTDGKYVDADTRRILLALWEVMDDEHEFNEVADKEAERQEAGRASDSPSSAEDDPASEHRASAAAPRGTDSAHSGD